MTIDTDTDTTGTGTGADDSTASGDQDQPDNETQHSGADGDAEDRSDAEDDQGDEDEGRGGNAEAAKYRRKLRDTETERDSLRGQLAAQRQAVLTAAAAARKVSPELVAKTVEIDDLLDDNGLLDPAAATAAIDNVIKTYGLPDTRPDGSGGASRSGGRKAERAGWGAVLSGNVRTQR